MTDFSETAANLNRTLNDFMERAEKVRAPVGHTSLLASGMRYQRPLFWPRSAAVRIVAVTTRLPLSERPYSLAVLEGSDPEAPFLWLANSLPTEANGLIGPKLDEDNVDRLRGMVFGGKPLRMPPDDAKRLFDRIVDASAAGAIEPEVAFDAVALSR